MNRPDEQQINSQAINDHSNTTDTGSDTGAGNISYRSWFPVFTATTTIFLLLFVLLLLADNPLQQPLVAWLNDHDRVWLFVPPWLVIVLFELVYSRGLQRRGDQIIEVLQQQRQTLLKNKGHLQQNLSQSWSQTDKLKRYISDKLVEVLEFDDKFYHFKGIASEIRHNGVISYDRVRTALHQAIEQERYLSLYEAGSAPEAEANVNSNSAQPTKAKPGNENFVNENNVDYFQASNDLNYLWDLLDLSTAENLDQHIAEYLLSQESLAYQQSLQQLQNQDQLSPQYDYFSLNQIILSAICRCIEDTEFSNLLRLSLINLALLNEEQQLENDIIVASLQSDIEILGKSNHLVLVLENLIRNAQFFQSKTKLKQAEDRIYLHTRLSTNFFELAVVNRGPQIPDENKEKIFQIGFSTRRSKGSHGKGLGLYFVDQIVKGYSGKIIVENRENQQTEYELTITYPDQTTIYHLRLSNDEKMNPLLTCLDTKLEPDNFASTQAKFKSPTIKESSRQIKLKLEHWPSQVSVKNLNTGLTQQLPLDLSGSDSINTEPTTWLDNSFQDLPGWSLTMKLNNKKPELIFKGLDRKGVCFRLFIPTLAGRMSGEDLESLLGQNS